MGLIKQAHGQDMLPHHIHIISCKAFGLSQACTVSMRGRCVDLPLTWLLI